LRFLTWLLLAAVVGFLLGNGPFSEWVEDVYHMLAVAWRGERLSRGSNGFLSLLVAGYLLGQGVYLLGRQVAVRLGPARIKQAERIASWDPSLRLGTRFGLHRYLENCVRWAAEDPTARTQSLALFKVRGIGYLNDAQGTLAATRLLQSIASDIRGATLPEASSGLKRWLTHFLPRPVDTSSGATMPPRYAARWTGSTFALAFRELDAVQAVTIAREVAAWIRSELDSRALPDQLSISASIAIGTPSVTARGLAAAAVQGIREKRGALITVVHDPNDVRSTVIGQMSDVDHFSISMDHWAADPTLASATKEASDLTSWLRRWGPSMGCIVGAIVWLQVTGSKVPLTTSNFAWPDSLDQVQVVDTNGPKTIRLQRRSLPPQSSSTWDLTDIRIVQGNPADGPFPTCMVHVTVRNRSQHKFYLSAFDFSAIDATGKIFQFDPQRMLRFEHGISGRWLKPDEVTSGWLLMYRRDAPITTLLFEPDRATRLEASITTDK
jgi:GGDEF domain-containing protein